MEAIELGIAIKNAIESKSVSQSELGRAVGRHRGLINRYLKGEVMPSADILIKMAKYLNISLDELVGLRISPMSYPSLEEAIDGVKEAEVEYINKTDLRLHKMETEIKDLKKDLDVMKRKIKAMS